MQIRDRLAGAAGRLAERFRQWLESDRSTRSIAKIRKRTAALEIDATAAELRIDKIEDEAQTLRKALGTCAGCGSVLSTGHPETILFSRPAGQRRISAAPVPPAERQIVAGCRWCAASIRKRGFRDIPREPAEDQQEAGK